MKTWAIKILILLGFWAMTPLFAYADMPAPTLSFNVNQQNISPGEAVSITWFSQNTDYCVASGDWYGHYLPSGSRDVYPTRTGNYGITCIGPNGSIGPYTQTIFVNQTPTNPPSTPVFYNTPTYTYYPSPAPTPIPSPQPVTSNFVAGCAASPTTAVVGQSVLIAAAQTGGTAPFTYTWSNDVSGSSQTVTTSFNSIGIKIATITITDAQGRTASNTCSITVNPATIAKAASAVPKAKLASISTAGTCQTITLCYDTNGKLVPKSSTPAANTNTTVASSDSNSGASTKKFFLASLFGGSGSSGGIGGWGIGIIAIIAAVIVILLGFAARKIMAAS